MTYTTSDQIVLSDLQAALIVALVNAGTKLAQKQLPATVDSIADEVGRELFAKGFRRLESPK